MDDKDVVKILRKIDKYNEAIFNLVKEIENSDHPHASLIVESLQDNMFDNPAWATHCGALGLTGWYTTHDFHLGVTKQKSKVVDRHGNKVY